MKIALVIFIITVFFFLLLFARNRKKISIPTSKYENTCKREEYLDVVGGVQISFFEDTQINIIFNFYPPVFEGEVQFIDDSKMVNRNVKEFDWENFSNILTNELGITVIHDDRELFYIENGSDEIVDKLVDFFKRFSN